MRHGILETTITGDLESNYDPVIRDQNLRSELQQHYRSILSPLQFSLDKHGDEVNNIENTWTLDILDTNSVIGVQSTEGMKRNGVWVPRSKGSRLRWLTTQDLEAHADSVVETSTGSDDVEYLKQGRFQLKTQLLFGKRGFWIELYMEHIRTQALAKWQEAKHDNEVSETELGKQDEKELLEWMLIYERVTMESILVDEMQKWEQALRAEHEQMQTSLVKKRESDSGWKDLQDRLEKDWNANTWMRLSGAKEAIRARLTQVTSPSPTLGSEWEQVLEEHWQMALRDIQEAWSELRRDPISSPLVDMAMKDADLFPTGILRMVGSMEQSVLRRYLDKGAISEKLYRIHDEMTRERAERFRSETKDMNSRVKRDHLPICDDFSMTGAKVIFGGARWREFGPWDTQGETMIKTIIRALERNKRIFFIQFSRYYGYTDNDAALAKAISLIHEITSVTTIAFSPATRIGRLTRLALLEALTKTKSIISVWGTNWESFPEINRQLILNAGHISINAASVTAHGFLVGKDADDENDHLFAHAGLKSRVDLRFVGRNGQPLLLRLRHRFLQPPRIIINDAVEISYPSTASKSFHLQTIQLEAIRDFRPDSPNVLSILPADEVYKLRDIDLVDEKGKSVFMDRDVDATSMLEEEEEEYHINVESDVDASSPSKYHISVESDVDASSPALEGEEPDTATSRLLHPSDSWIV
ncbi:hypothetical protein FPV67DRAFT_158265 [Lyophyllum atratum]|nr:hypothetical protein FPV67DRAFT_158265 [Lyophyllum atratum]